jgi:hypothetical protein
MVEMSRQRITTVVLDPLSLTMLRLLAMRRAELEGGRVSGSHVVRDLIRAAAEREGLTKKGRVHV